MDLNMSAEEVDATSKASDKAEDKITEEDSVTDNNTLQGNALWDALQKPPISLKLHSSLRNVLEIMGYDNIYALQRFGQEDFQKIEEFMRNSMHRIIKNKGSAIDQQKEMALYYGVFSSIPEEFILLGGFRHTLEACVQAAASLKKERVTRPKSLTPHSQRQSTPSKDPSETIVKEEKQLQTNISKWIQQKAAHILGETEVDEEQQVKISVYLNDSNILTAKVECPAPDCTTKVALHKNPTTKSWNTGNFYRHVSAIHILKPVTEKCNSISSFFAKKRKSAESSTLNKQPKLNDGESVEDVCPPSSSKQQDGDSVVNLDSSSTSEIDTESTTEDSNFQEMGEKQL